MYGWLVGWLVGWMDGWMYKGVVPRKEEGHSTGIQEIMWCEMGGGVRVCENVKKTTKRCNWNILVISYKE